MSEALLEQKRELWNDGPNYAADAVVIDPAAAKILLIQRRDTGEWALPGGFIDPTDESSLDAAKREAHEEAGVTLPDYAPLIYRGVVDDPRNSETAWIETSAHLFAVEYRTDVREGDDADAAAWYDLADIPPLYGSHQRIVERALDYLEAAELHDVFRAPDSIVAVDGGHMEYGKTVAEKAGQTVFIKQHNKDRFSDADKANRSYTYLEKEALTMAHVRQHDFNGVPGRSMLVHNSLLMEALRPEDGWQWRAPTDAVDAYINDTLSIFNHLETVPVAADSFDIEPSYTSFIKEGWWALDDEAIAALHTRAQDFMPHLTPDSQASAIDMFSDLPLLQKAGSEPRPIDTLVFCHHDVRQSNLAWHPNHGSKLVDWSWAGLGTPKSDATSFLIDLHKSGHDISSYRQSIDPRHCLTLLGFWLGHSTWPHRGDDTVRFQQFLSALSAYEVLRGMQ